MRIGIFGIGSPHGDDQIGWLLVDALKPLLPADVVCEKLSDPAYSLITLMPQFDQVIVVDACAMAKNPGEYQYIKDGAGFLHQQNAHLSSHTLSLSESWQLLLKLEQPLPQISLFLVQLGQTAVMAPLSACVAEQIPEMINKLHKTVKLQCLN